VSESWKPQGHRDVAPYLLVEDARGLIAFLQAVFDARPGRQFEGPDGAIMHAEVAIGDSIVMMGEATEKWRAFPSMIHVYVEDVDSIYQRALAEGARTVQEPVRGEGDPDRRCGFEDPAGNSWWVSTQAGG
jgi:PhnB protein